MITGVFELAASATSFEPLVSLVSLELSYSAEDSGLLKTSAVGALGIGMSVSRRYGFRADW